jgi:hypothetical protein
VPPRDARTRFFVASLADGPSRFVLERGAPVAVLITTGHRVADAYGIRNVSPYTGVESIHTVEQVGAVVGALRRAGGNTVVLPAARYSQKDAPLTPTDPGMFEAFAARGYALLTPRGLQPYNAERGLRDARVLPWQGGMVVKLVDTRHLHPRALR